MTKKDTFNIFVFFFFFFTFFSRTQTLFGLRIPLQVYPAGNIQDWPVTPHILRKQAQIHWPQWRRCLNDFFKNYFLFSCIFWPCSPGHQIYFLSLFVNICFSFIYLFFFLISSHDIFIDRFRVNFIYLHFCIDAFRWNDLSRELQEASMWISE